MIKKSKKTEKVAVDWVNKNHKTQLKKVSGKKRERKQSLCINQELTIRFLEFTFPYRDENKGSKEWVNKYFLDNGFARLLEPYYSSYEMRMKFIKEENLLDNYVLFLQKELQDLVFNNMQEWSLKEALLQGWFINKEEAKFVGLT